MGDEPVVRTPDEITIEDPGVDLTKPETIDFAGDIVCTDPVELVEWPVGPNREVYCGPLNDRDAE